MNFEEYIESIRKCNSNNENTVIEKIYELEKDDKVNWGLHNIGLAYLELLELTKNMSGARSLFKANYIKDVLISYHNYLLKQAKFTDIQEILIKIDVPQIREYFIYECLKVKKGYYEFWVSMLEAFNYWCMYMPITPKERAMFYRAVEQLDIKQRKELCSRLLKYKDLCIQLELVIDDKSNQEDKEVAEEVVQEDKKVVEEVIQEDKEVAEEVVQEDKKVAEEVIQEANEVVEEGAQENNEVAKEAIREDKEIVEENPIKKDSETIEEQDVIKSNEEIYRENMILLHNQLIQIKLEKTKLESQNENLKQEKNILRNKCIRLEEEKAELKEQVTQRDSIIEDLYQENNKVKAVSIQMEQEKQAALDQLAKIQETNITLSTMMDKGDQFKEEAYKKRLANKLQLEYSQFSDIKEVMEMGIDDENAKDMMDMLYMSVCEIWTILEKNDIKF